jgi:trimeric autotransporter adhesin
LAARRTLSLLALTAALALPARAAEEPPSDPSQDVWRGSHRSKRIRTLTLNHRALAALMAGAPREHGRAARERPLVVSLPAPEGGFQRFAVHESPVMEPALAAMHPEIKTYSGQGLDSPASTIRFDLSPLGLHASVRGPQGMWYVEPSTPSIPDDDSLYQSYFRRDVVDNPHGPLVESEAEVPEIFADRGYYHPPDPVGLRGAGFAPLAPIVVTISADEGSSRTVDTAADASGAFDVTFVADPDERLGTRLVEATDGTSTASSAYDVVTAEDTSVDPPVGDQLRTYRLALLTDPTYGGYFGPANVTAAKVALVNRVTHVYESETSIRLMLIDNNDVLNLNTDAQMTGLNGPCGGAACFTPTQATSCASALSRIRQVIGLLVGASNYDVGHMALGLNAGGMASLAVVGGNNKAMGCTGLANPVGDSFAVDYVAHEMGHQFSGNHTFNGTSGSCMGTNRNTSTSVEPGGGSSIMGRAGMCQTDDLQAHSDPYWSPRSFDEITNFVAAAEANINDVQMAALTGFDGTDSFQLRYNGKDSAPIVRGTNFTNAGIQAAIQGIAGWPAFGTASVSIVPDTSFTITLGGSLVGMDVSPISLVNCKGCTGYIGEVAKGGPTTHRGKVDPTGNSYPVVTVPAQFTIPLRTPFALTGSATDADGDTLTYTWEQNDRGGPTGTALMSDLKTNGPLFRQFGSAAVVSASDALEYDPPGENAAGTEATRVFPDLAQILANDTNAENGTCPAGDVDCFSEFLPTAAYVGVAGVNASPPSLHFRLTARDGRADGGGVNTATTTLVLAANAGPFLVTAPNTAETYPGGSIQTVRWDVANTNLPPVQTTDVRIRLSIDGGHTYPYDLAASAPNDGAETVVLPNVGTIHARVKVEAIGNIFFDVSNRDFTIHALPVVTSSAPAGATVQYSDSLSSAVTVSAVDADSPGAALVASVTGLPAGLSLVPASVSDDATRPGTATWAVAGKVAAAPGTYNVRVTVADEADDADSSSFAITVSPEDAEVTYTGDVLAFTSPGAATATVVLRATVRDGSFVPSLADREAGDITNAKVTFQENGVPLCEPRPVTALEGTTSGTVSCSVELGPGPHWIDVVVDGYYKGASRSVVEILAPEGSFLGGAGRLVLDASGGRYGATAGSKAQFALGLKYKPKAPRDPKGHIEVVFRVGSQTYVIRSSGIDLLGVSEEAPSGKQCHGHGATCMGRADMRWTATLIDVTDARKPITVGSNLALQVTVTDRGDHHGSGDAIGITLWDGSALLFSSSWTGSQTVEQVLEAGKITVD